MRANADQAGRSRSGASPASLHSPLACIVRLVFSIALCLLLVGCSECQITSTTDYASPDTKHVVTIYGYTCHDTTGLYWYADLRRVGARLQHPGNVIAFGLGDMVSHLTVAWQSSTQLLVSYPFDSQRLPAATNIDGVTITFATAAEIAESEKR